MIRRIVVTGTADVLRCTDCDAATIVDRGNTVVLSNPDLHRCGDPDWTIPPALTLAKRPG